MIGGTAGKVAAALTMGVTSVLAPSLGLIPHNNTTIAAEIAHGLNAQENIGWGLLILITVGGNAFLSLVAGVIAECATRKKPSPPSASGEQSEQADSLDNQLTPLSSVVTDLPSSIRIPDIQLASPVGEEEGERRPLLPKSRLSSSPGAGVGAK